ncbi:MAG: cupin [Rhodospirillales bacterium CG15_BIG_FIL_POST_REV_8_21_14_020_66_15]|nr:MAG: cupin [Rhodospirillales bacterium CG15_BIG_FIL_POST_REV_8_21_14_020_66_15]
MTTPIRNLFRDLPDASGAEAFTRLAEGGAFRLERIVSTGQATPEGQWYDQPEDEWVVLLKGAAGLRIEGEDEARTLAPGDCVLLPARRRHRVEWTAAEGPTVWLALHFQPASGPG